MFSKIIILLLSTLTFASTQIQIQPPRDIQTCIVAVHQLTDSLLDLASAIEQNHFDPGSSAFVAVLDRVQGIITICANSETSILKYEQCVTALYPVLPTIGDLIDAIQNGYTQNIIEDSVSLAKTITEGIALCVDISE